MIRRWSTATTVAVVVSLIAACSSSSKPHGNPDPGGARLAALAQVATAVMPTHATPIHLTLSPSKWSHGGCDGGPAGWTNMEAVQTFAATGNVVADIDANMKRLHWSIVPQGGSGGSRSSQYPPSAAPGANAPYAREYEQSASADDPAAWLFTPNQTGRSYWEIDLVRPPAELRAADC